MNLKKNISRHLSFYSNKQYTKLSLVYFFELPKPEKPIIAAMSSAAGSSFANVDSYSATFRFLLSFFLSRR